MTFKIGDIVKFESMYSFGVVVDLRGRLIIVKWFDDFDLPNKFIKVSS